MRVLIVEDDPDGRELLEELFRMHEWSVTAVRTTDAALSELRRGGFDVVISDEDLDGQSGASMLRAASDEGLLRKVGVLMYTAEPGRPAVPKGVRVLRKPLAITKLLDEAEASQAAQRRVDGRVDAPPTSRRSLTAFMDRLETPAPISSRRTFADAPPPSSATK